MRVVATVDRRKRCDARGGISDDPRWWDLRTDGRDKRRQCEVVHDEVDV
jgi:hypothetical protein